MLIFLQKRFKSDFWEVKRNKFDWAITCSCQMFQVIVERNVFIQLFENVWNFGLRCEAALRMHLQSQ